MLFIVTIVTASLLIATGNYSNFILVMVGNYEPFDSYNLFLTENFLSFGFIFYCVN